MSLLDNIAGELQYALNIVYMTLENDEHTYIDFNVFYIFFKT